MLSKLIKHEWQSTSKIGYVILLTIAGITLIGTMGITLLINYNKEVIYLSLSDGEGVAGIFWVMVFHVAVMLYSLSFVGVSYSMLIYLSVRFYKTMYSEEGYLTHTLPVTPRQLLLSKTLVAGVWYLLMGLGITLSVGILIGAIVTSLNGGIVEALAEIQRELVEALGKNNIYGLVLHGIVSMLVAIIVTPISTMMTIFGSLTVGQLAQKYRAFMGILVYIGVVFVHSILNNVLVFLFMIVVAVENWGSPTAGLQVFFAAFDTATLLAVGMAVVFYFISHNILIKKFNLE